MSPLSEVHLLGNWENKVIWWMHSIIAPMLLVFIPLCGPPPPHRVWAGSVTHFWLIEYGRGDKRYASACIWFSFPCCFEEASCYGVSFYMETSMQQGDEDGINPLSQKETEVLSPWPAMNWMLQITMEVWKQMLPQSSIRWNCSPADILITACDLLKQRT